MHGPDIWEKPVDTFSLSLSLFDLILWRFPLFVFVYVSSFFCWLARDGPEMHFRQCSQTQSNEHKNATGEKRARKTKPFRNKFSPVHRTWACYYNMSYYCRLLLLDDGRQLAGLGIKKKSDLFLAQCKMANYSAPAHPSTAHFIHNKSLSLLLLCLRSE